MVDIPLLFVVIFDDASDLVHPKEDFYLGESCSGMLESSISVENLTGLHTQNQR